MACVDDIGELLFAGGVGGVTVLLIGLGYWRGGPDARIVTRDISILILLLAGLGVGVDVIHVISYYKAPLLAQFLLILEDGGEMLVVSATAAYVFNVPIPKGGACGLVGYHARLCQPSLASPRLIPPPGRFRRRRGITYVRRFS